MTLNITSFRRFICASAILAASSQGHATELYSDDNRSVSLTGRADILFISEREADAAGESEIVDNGSRINFTFQQDLTTTTSVQAVFEWGIDAVSTSNYIEFNGGSSSVSQGSGNSFLKNRFGYLEIANQSYGRVQVGKVRSVYLQVTQATDEMNVYSALASATYTYGDGGIAGTGRAEQTARWDRDFEALGGTINIGAQVQLMDRDIDVKDDSDAVIGSILDSGGLGASLRYELDGFNFGIAAIKDDLSGRIEGVEVRNIRAMASSVSYSDGPIYAAIVATSSDGMMQDEQGRPYDGAGYEIYARYEIGYWKPAIGINYTTSSESEFSIFLTTLGLGYEYPNTGFKLYFEAGVDSGFNSDGSDSQRDYVSFGAQYKF